MINQTVLTGNLGKDPAEFYSGDGNPVSKFSLAFKSGRDRTGWINVVCFNRLAEVASKYLHKGARIAVVGTLQYSKWETEEGIQKSTYELLANTLEFIKTDGRGMNQQEEESQEAPF